MVWSNEQDTRLLVCFRSRFASRLPYSRRPEDAHQHEDYRTQQAFHCATSLSRGLAIKRCTASHTSSTVTDCMQVQFAQSCILPRKKHGRPVGCFQIATC